MIGHDYVPKPVTRAIVADVLTLIAAAVLFFAFWIITPA